MPTEDEMEQVVNEHLDSRRKQDAILKIEIETLKKAVAKVEDLSGFHKGEGTGTAD